MASAIIEPDRTTASDELDDLGKKAFNLYEEYSSSKYRAGRIDRAKKNREMYDGYRAAKDFPWEDCANYSVMLPAIVVDEMEPRVAAQVSGYRGDIVDVKPTRPEAIEATKAVEEFAEWATQYNIKWGTFVRSAVHNLLLDGACYTLPRYEERTVTRSKRIAGMGFKHPATGKIIDHESQDGQRTIAAMAALGVVIPQGPVDGLVEYEDREFRVINEVIPLQFHYGPDGLDDEEFKKAPSILKRFFRYSDLKRNDGNVYINIDEKIKGQAKQARNDSDTPLNADRSGYQPEKEPGRDEIECIECYLPDEVLEDGDRPDWVLLTYAVDSRTCIRKQYLREVHCDNRKPVLRHTIFGEQGIPERVQHFAGAIDTIVNQMIDSGDVSLVPWGFIGSGVTLARELEIYPGSLNPVTGNAADINFPTINPVTTVWIEIINMLVSFMERLVSVSTYNAGIEDAALGQGAGTASGMRMMLNEGQVKHNYMSQPIKEQFAEVLAKDIKLYGWFMPTDTQIPSGKEFKAVNIAALQDGYTISINISDVAHNEMLARREAMELMDIAMKLPFANQAEAFNDLLSAYQKKQPERYLNPAFMSMLQAFTTNPQVAEVVQRFMAQQAQALEIQKMQKAVSDSMQRRDYLDQAQAAKIIEEAPSDFTPEEVMKALQSIRNSQVKDVVEASLNSGVNTDG